MFCSSKTDANITQLPLQTVVVHPDNINTKQSQPTRSRIVENLFLIWLVSHGDESKKDFHDSISQLRWIVNTIEIFNDIDQCIDFLTENKFEKSFMIIPANLSRHIVPLIHCTPQLDSIYVFAEENSICKEWFNEWSKVKGVFTEIAHICQSLEQAVRQCDRNSISLSILPPTSAVYENSYELDQSFMYTQLLKEVLLEFEFSDRSINVLATHCRDLYRDNKLQLRRIDEFEREYCLKPPILWYTYASFIYTVLNRSLRTQEIDTLIPMGVFIRDLHRNIEELHSQQSNGTQLQPFTVYRGQGVSNIDFEMIKKNQGGLLSFNNFLSTSIDRDVSFAFADSNRSNPDLTGVLFQMAIDPTISSIPFAALNAVSHFTTENEILFSTHTVFRIDEIKNMDESNRLWQVELTITRDHDEQLGALTARMREDISSESRPHQLAQLLIKLGEFDKAKQLYEALLHLAPDEIQKAVLYYHIGLINHLQGNYLEAIALHEKSLEIEERALSETHPFLAGSYNSIGAVYDDMGDYKKAISFLKKALEIYQKISPQNHLDLARSYNNLGAVFDKMGQYSEALSYFEKALEIRQKILPQNHPDIAQLYNNIGGLYYNIGDYSKALISHQAAIEINEKVLPPNHPLLATSYNNIGGVYYEMKEYKKALVCYGQACKIYQKTLPPNHPNLAASYTNLGSVCDCMKDYSKAILFHEKALAIDQNILDPNHPSLATSYNNISAVYCSMADYLTALSYSQKALDIYQNALLTDHPLSITTYNNIGFIYNEMGEYPKALQFYECAAEIAQKSLPQSHPNLQSLQQNIDLVKEKLRQKDSSSETS